MKVVLEGRNRFVILTRRYAIKIPALRCWRDFLFGLLNNLNEAAQEHPACCPVLWCAPGGFVLVMPHAERIEAFDPATLPLVSGAERKPSSWGVIDGRTVAIDYGWPENAELELKGLKP